MVTTGMSSGIRDQGIKWQLHLKDKNIPSDTLRQTLELDIIKLVSGSSIRHRKRVTRHCGGAGPLPGRRRNGSKREQCDIMDES